MEYISKELNYTQMDINFHASREQILNGIKKYLLNC